MKKTVLILTAFALIASSCNQAAKQQSETAKTDIAVEQDNTFAQKAEDFVPENEKIFKKISGDLNGDGKNDVILLTTETNEFAFIDGEDRNNRGIVIAFKKDNGYELIARMPYCFSPEPSDDYYQGISLKVEIKNGKLYISHTYGRYGNYAYTFRYQNNYFEVIGFDYNTRIDEEESIIFETKSINFLTKKMKVQTEILHWYGEEQIKDKEETWHNITIKNLVKLTDIDDFENFVIDKYYKEKK